VHGRGGAHSTPKTKGKKKEKNRRASYFVGGKENERLETVIGQKGSGTGMSRLTKKKMAVRLNLEKNWNRGGMGQYNLGGGNSRESKIQREARVKLKWRTCKPGRKKINQFGT